MPRAIQAMAWANPAYVAGMETTSLASSSIDVAYGAEDVNNVIIRKWADAAAGAVNQVKGVKNNSLPKLIEDDVVGLIRGDGWWARERLVSIRDAQENNPSEIERRGRKWADRIISILVDMDHLKITLEDIPNFDQPRWRPLVYRGTELTAADFAKIKRPLLRSVKRQRDVCISLLLRDYVPPTPSSVSNPCYHGPEDITGIFVGKLPAKVFLKVGCKLPVVGQQAAYSSVERTSKEVRLLLQSLHVDHVWSTIRLSLGLTVAFKYWPERAFLAFALSRTCTIVLGAGEAYISFWPKNPVVSDHAAWHLVLSIPTLLRPYINAGWIHYVKGCEKLVKTDYADAMLNWFHNLPKAVKIAVPNETLAKHVMELTRPFLNIANQFESWQSSRDPDNLLLIQRREAWIIHRIKDQHLLDVSNEVLQSFEWKEVVTHGYPMSLKVEGKPKLKVKVQVKQDSGDLYVKHGTRKKTRQRRQLNGILYSPEAIGYLGRHR
ncbi:hypothetical protein M407DRAFT_11075 [Tulasnella calospora MUT 4182]|uniref:Uncharacterized protein n=1 Tax=Tulasnella calospora MUT 4182 TaxID=1051891 RepID=A0A0C3PY10_9AGAM|nr:hypothetical protein M407DRAFT_11075 [Tulasnella calospora MUT 4182]